MENLLAIQNQLIGAIEQLLINFKKDGADRKTPANIKKRLDTLEAYWVEFRSNHSQLCQYEDHSNEYFTKNTYEKTKQFYGEVRSYLQQYLKEKTLVDKPGTSTDSISAPSTRDDERPTTPKVINYPPSTKEPLPELFAQEQYQRSRRDQGSPSKLEEMLRKQKKKWEYQDVLRNLETRWAAIDSLHWEIDSELVEENEEYEETFNTYENQYNDIKRSINSKMWAVTYKEKTTPIMDIPFFNGDYHKWVSFKDLFTESIHNNNSMSNAQKMQFLKSKIKGDAEKLIQHLRITSDNYLVCWDILNHRYNNTKLIFSSHINIMMSLPTMQQQSPSHIKKIHDTTNECLNAIKNLGVDISTWDPLIIHLLTQKLDADTHKDYIESLENPRDLPIMSEFLEFLENKFTSLEASRRKQDHVQQKSAVPSLSNNKKPYFNQQYQNNPKGDNRIAKAFHVSTKITCPHCNSKKHGIFHCKNFLSLTSDMKLKTANKLKLCTNCLYDHTDNKCFSTKTCPECSALHNTLLHDAFTKAQQPPTSKINNEQVISHSTAHVSRNQSAEILLATALIAVKGADGTRYTMRALIDQGSQVSLITENAAQKLALPRRRCKGVVFGLGARENNCKGVMEITMSALHGDFTFNSDVFIMRNLINNLPNQTFEKPSWSHIQNITLADPEFYNSRPVDLLLGADIYSLIVLGGVIKGDNLSQPIAQQKHLGWLLCGNVKTYQCNVVLNNMEDIHRFWSIEDIGDNTLNMSSEDYACVQLYEQHTTRQEDGRYVVRLPMKPDAKEQLGESKRRTVAQFLQLEKKLKRNPNIAKDYRDLMNEYINLGHMCECTSNETPSCYLPHHCVIRSESTTTGLRAVFNASSPTSSGRSLNDLMYCGPNLQSDLLSLILRWRQYKIAFTADIEKMFRQILVHEKDQHLQKIIWRDSTDQLLREYVLTTVTYGTKAAPFLAMRTLKQLAIDEGFKYPSAAKALEEEFYMDDLLSGSHSIEAARQLQADLINLLKPGGFNLRKWSSNEH
ncbi:uncharacterized protein LOC113234292 [Hyposmocoma kahamanoa]|uniref:uncharacterized protein LOC113234292 n=1 Tax=Hyposmocoma kahamanoa TaxID=1477025 RepID=UPI000E6D620D|nr:uncharacterized protein LOC113234292 [Hyposmocoma kahamanoa]